MNVKTLLDVEIERLHDELAKLDPSSKEYSTVDDNLGKLVNLKLEIEKHDSAEAFNEQQLKEARKTRNWKNAIDLGLGIGGLALSGVGAYLMFVFEEKGTITTMVGRKLADKILTFKK